MKGIKYSHQALLTAYREVCSEYNLGKSEENQEELKMLDDLVIKSIAARSFKPLVAHFEGMRAAVDAADEAYFKQHYPAMDWHDKKGSSDQRWESFEHFTENNPDKRFNEKSVILEDFIVAADKYNSKHAVKIKGE